MFFFIKDRGRADHDLVVERTGARSRGSLELKLMPIGAPSVLADARKRHRTAAEENVCWASAPNNHKSKTGFVQGFLVLQPGTSQLPWKDAQKQFGPQDILTLASTKYFAANRVCFIMARPSFASHLWGKIRKWTKVFSREARGCFEIYVRRPLTAEEAQVLVEQLCRPTASRKVCVDNCSNSFVTADCEESAARFGYISATNLAHLLTSEKLQPGLAGRLQMVNHC